MNDFEHWQLSDGILVVAFNNNTPTTFDTWFKVIEELYKHDIDTLHMRFIYILNTNFTSYGVKKITEIVKTTPNSITGSVALLSNSRTLRSVVNNIFLMVNPSMSYRVQVFETQPQAATWLRERTDLLLKETNKQPFSKIVWDVASET